MDPFYITVGLMVMSLALGFYVGRVGLTGIEADISAVKSDISAIKSHVVPTSVQVNNVPPAVA